MRSDYTPSIMRILEDVYDIYDMLLFSKGLYFQRVYIDIGKGFLPLQYLWASYERSKR